MSSSEGDKFKDGGIIKANTKTDYVPIKVSPIMEFEMSIGQCILLYNSIGLSDKDILYKIKEDLSNEQII